MKTVRTVLIILLVIVAVTYLGLLLKTDILSDRTPPVISIQEQLLEVSVYDSKEVFLRGVTARDNRDGNLTDKVLIAGVSKLLTDNRAKVTYLVFDSSDNMASAERYICYTDYSKPVMDLTGPLVFAAGSGISINGKVTAEDVIDGDLSDKIRVSAMDASLNTSGLYSITLSVTNSMGDTSELTLPVLVTETGTNNGEILLSDYLITIPVGSTFDAMDYVEAGITASGRKVTLESVSVSGTVNTEVPGTYSVVYECDYGSSDMLSALVVIVEEGREEQ